MEFGDGLLNKNQGMDLKSYLNLVISMVIIW